MLIHHLSQNNRAFRSNPNQVLAADVAQIGAKSQNNRAFRSNPNQFILTLMKNKSESLLRHKITEPSAQIPTWIFMTFSMQFLNRHKITEPSAQIPTKMKKYRRLKMKSQNNRAFRSNPNSFLLGRSWRHLERVTK